MSRLQALPIHTRQGVNTLAYWVPAYLISNTVKKFDKVSSLTESVKVNVDVDRQLQHEEHVLHLFPTFGVDRRVGVVDDAFDVLDVDVFRRRGSQLGTTERCFYKLMVSVTSGSLNSLI